MIYGSLAVLGLVMVVLFVLAVMSGNRGREASTNQPRITTPPVSAIPHATSTAPSALSPPGTNSATQEMLDLAEKSSREPQPSESIATVPPTLKVGDYATVRTPDHRGRVFLS